MFTPDIRTRVKKLKFTLVLIFSEPFSELFSELFDCFFSGLFDFLKTLAGFSPN